MSGNGSVGICWIRRDLRLQDHHALYEACRNHTQVVVVFCFDSEILKYLKKEDRRITFIYESLKEIKLKLQKSGSDLVVLQGDAKKEVVIFAESIKAEAVYVNHDYEPQAIARDREVLLGLKEKGISFFTFKDQVIFEKDEILNGSGQPYKVFTAYKNNWLKQFKKSQLSAFKVNHKKLIIFKNLKNILKNTNYQNSIELPSFAELGFIKQELWLKPGMNGARLRLKNFLKTIQNYKEQRNFAADIEGTSGLSVHLRFGTISIREVMLEVLSSKMKEKNVFVSELIWREFYMQILYHFPYVVKGAFKKEYDQMKWPNNKKYFKAWCEGKTGYPLVDAAMIHFNQTGWMHNRLRMIVASFLCKDLQIDYKWGEKYFAENLLDFDLAANNGGWQWSASTGCDAQPYFRIFNPSIQQQKYDPQNRFIKSVNPKLLDKLNQPIVEHSKQKQSTLALYKKIK